MRSRLRSDAGDSCFEYVVGNHMIFDWQNATTCVAHTATMPPGIKRSARHDQLAAIHGPGQHFTSSLKPGDKCKARRVGLSTSDCPRTTGLEVGGCRTKDHNDGLIILNPN
jgi:hypothetical protein